MDIKIRLVDSSLPLPEYQTQGAVAFDLATRTDLTIPPGEVAYAPLNICVEPPAGHMLLIAARSSLHKRGLMLANGIGIGDEDFSGNEDEYHAPLYNFSKEAVRLSRGERIVQGMFVPVTKGTWLPVGDMENKNRGGFGSTGI